MYNSTHLLSFGTQTEQWHINRNDHGYWLVHSRRDTGDRLKVKITAEQSATIRDQFDSLMRETLKKNTNRSDVYIKNAADTSFRHKKA